MNLKRILASFVSVTVAAASFYAVPLTLAASDAFDTVTELRLASAASREAAVALLENDANFIAGGQADADTPNYNFQADFTADDGVRFGWPDACQVSTTESLENYRFSARFRNHASLQWAGISVRDNANTLCTENTTVIAEEPEPDGNPHAQVIGASTQGIVFMNNAPHADQHNFAVAVRKADDAQNAYYFKTSIAQSYFHTQTLVRITDTADEIIYEAAHPAYGEIDSAAFTPLVKVTLDPNSKNAGDCYTSGEVFEYTENQWSSLGTFDNANVPPSGKVKMLSHNGWTDLSYLKLETKKAPETPGAVSASPEAGTYCSAQSVTLTGSGQTGAQIFYTTDESDPTDGGTEYMQPIEVSATTTIKAAEKLNGEFGGVSTFTYTISDSVEPGYQVFQEPTDYFNPTIDECKINAGAGQNPPDFTGTGVMTIGSGRYCGFTYVAPYAGTVDVRIRYTADKHADLVLTNEASGLDADSATLTVERAPGEGNTWNVADGQIHVQKGWNAILLTTPVDWVNIDYVAFGEKVTADKTGEAGDGFMVYQEAANNDDAAADEIFLYTNEAPVTVEAGRDGSTGTGAFVLGTGRGASFKVNAEKAGEATFTVKYQADKTTALTLLNDADGGATQADISTAGQQGANTWVTESAVLHLAQGENNIRLETYVDWVNIDYVAVSDITFDITPGAVTYQPAKNNDFPEENELQLENMGVPAALRRYIYGGSEPGSFDVASGRAAKFTVNAPQDGVVTMAVRYNSDKSELNGSPTTLNFVNTTLGEDATVRLQTANTQGGWGMLSGEVPLQKGENVIRLDGNIDGAGVDCITVSPMQGVDPLEPGYTVYQEPEKENWNNPGALEYSLNAQTNWEPNRAKHTGAGAVSIGSGRTAEFKVDAPIAGTGHFKVRFATDIQNGAIHLINKTTGARLEISTAGIAKSWAEWVFAEGDLELQQGENTIMLEGNLAGAYVDYVAVSNEITPPSEDLEPGFAIYQEAADNDNPQANEIKLINCAYRTDERTYTGAGWFENGTFGERSAQMTIHAAEAGTVTLRVKYSTDKTGNIVFSNAANGELASVVTTSVHPAWGKSEATLHLAQGDNLITINFDQDWVAMDYVAVSELTPDEPSLEPGFTVYQEAADNNNPQANEVKLINCAYRTDTPQMGADFTGLGWFENGTAGGRSAQITVNAETSGTAAIRVRYASDKPGTLHVSNTSNGEAVALQAVDSDLQWVKMEGEITLSKGENIIRMAFDQDWFGIDYIALSNEITPPDELEPGFTVFQEPADVNNVLDGEITLVNNNVVKTEQDGSTGPGCFEIGIGDRKGQIYYYAPKNGTATVRVRYLADKERNITVENKTNKASAVRQSANVNPNWDVLEYELKVQKGSNTILLSTDSDWIIIDYIAVSNMVTQAPEDLEPGYNVLQGEDMSLNGCNASTTTEGFTGTGFIDAIGGGRTATFTYHSDTAGVMSFKIRHATDMGGAFNIINSDTGKTDNISWANNQGWFTWVTGETEVQVLAGDNHFTLEGTGIGSNVDYVAISKSPAPQPGYTVIQPEDMVLKGASVLTDQAGYTGQGYIDAIGAGREARFAFHSSGSGTRKLRICFATDQSGNFVLVNADTGENTEVSWSGATGWNNWVIGEAEVPVSDGENQFVLQGNGAGALVDYVAFSRTLDSDLEPGFIVFQETTKDNWDNPGEFEIGMNAQTNLVSKAGDTGNGCFEIGSSRKGNLVFNAPEDGTFTVHVKYLSDKSIFNGSPAMVSLVNDTDGTTDARQTEDTKGSWKVMEMSLHARKGANSIHIESSSDWTTIDYIAISDAYRRDVQTDVTGFMVFQPEDMTLLGSAAIATDDSVPFSGQGYISNLNSENGVSVKVESSAAGKKTVKILYMANQSGQFSINGKAFSFAASVNKDKWSVFETTLDVAKGVNEISVYATTGAMVDVVLVSEATDVTESVLSQLPGKTPEQAKALVDENYDALGVDFKADRYFSKIDELAFYEVLLSKDVSTLDKFKTAAYTSIGIQAVKSLPAAELREAVPILTDSKKPYKLALKLEAYGCLKFADKELSALCAELAKSGAKTAQELNADILKAAAKTIMTCADRAAKTTYLTTLLENASVDLGIPQYGSWPSGGEKQRYVIKTMLDKGYTTYEQFLKDLADAVKNAPEDKGGGVVTKPSGSGSSSSTSYEGISNEQIAPPKTQTFKDVPQSHWAYEAVEEMAKSKVITGYADGSFQPDKAITREEFVKILLAGLSVTVQKGENVFSDVDANSWYADYVNTAYALGIVNGRGDDSFGTGEPITRQDMAVMLAKAAEAKKLALSGDKEMNFKDQNEIAPYALAAVSQLVAAGILNGVSDSEFAPGQTVTRAMAAQVIYNVRRNYND